MTTKRQNEKKAATIHYYRLNPACEKGKEFLAVVGEGVAAEREAEKIVKKYKAVGLVPNPWADFGGIGLFAFKKNRIVNPAIFKDCEREMTDGNKLYEINMTFKQELFEWDKMPEDAPNIIKSKHEFLPAEVLRAFPRKVVAHAIGMELKYLHPLEALNLLGIEIELRQAYLAGQKTLKEVLEGKLFVKKRDKQLVQFAYEGEKEDKMFVEEVSKHTYGHCTFLFGHPEAVALFCDCQALPVVPQGTLNAIVGLDASRYRCGFFTHKNWIWVKSHNESTLPLDDDWQQVTKEEWEENCKDAKNLTRKKG